MDDPKQSKPDIELAKIFLIGLLCKTRKYSDKTIKYFKEIESTFYN